MPANHTPGPWKTGGDGCEVHSDGGDLLAEGAIAGEGRDVKADLAEFFANIRLMAAAPDLFKMVREMTELIGAVMIDDREPAESPLSIVRRAYSLIGRIEGEA